MSGNITFTASRMMALTTPRRWRRSVPPVIAASSMDPIVGISSWPCGLNDWSASEPNWCAFDGPLTGRSTTFLTLLSPKGGCDYHQR